jgi:hypothetical protein
MRIVIGVVIIAVAMLIAIGGLVLVQRLVSTERRRQHNDVAGFIYTVLGVSYAVLLGLMLISLTLFTVAALDYPFKGHTSIHPSAFEQVLERFHESKLSHLQG